MQESAEERRQPQTRRSAACRWFVMLCQPSPGRWGCSPFTLLHPLLGNAYPHPSCHRRGSPSLGQGWCQTHCLCPCARERTASAPGSWDLQRRARVVGKKRQLGPKACCQVLRADPKSRCKGREVLVAQTSPGAALWGPQQHLGGDVHPVQAVLPELTAESPCPHASQEPLGVPAPAGRHLQLTDAILLTSRVVSWSHTGARTAHPSPAANAPSSPLSHGALGQVTASHGTLLTPASGGAGLDLALSSHG